MRFYSPERAGYDRLIATVVATVMIGTAGVAAAQSVDAPRNAAAELAIEAGVPMPESANVPPPTAADIKAMDSTSPPAKAVEVKPEPAKEIVKDIVKDTLPAKNAEAPATSAPVTSAPVVSTPAAPAEPAIVSKVAAADQPVADRLRDLLMAKTSRHFDRKGERAAVEMFYATRDFAPLWTTDGALNQRAKDAMARLKAADADGLDAGDYPTPDFAATAPEARADAELKLTAALLDYARHAQTGRIHYSRISADIFYPDHTPEPADILSSLASTTNVAAALDSYNPPHKGYKALKAKLAELRGQTDTPLAPLLEGPALKLVKKAPIEDQRVPALRARLGLTENADDTRYDAQVAEAVRKFQANAGLGISGTLDNATVRAINAPKRDRQIDTVLANMERWRWLPRQLGEPKLGGAYVMLNIPEFTLRVMKGDAMVWNTRVVTGKTNTATPELTETMKYITVNPTWNVPPSIIYNEYLPALEQDPTVLDRMGLRLSQNRDGSIHISQPPGERNALGRIRFNFPNKFLVYQHDTPDKHLFAKDERAFSHGCMRVQNPDQYAEVLLGITNPAERYTAARIRSMYGNSELNINLITPIPVHIVYQTAFVDEAGKLDIRKDVYGRDARILAQLRGSDRRVADIAIERPQPNYSRPPARLPAGVAFAGDGGYPPRSRGGFFDRLFGGYEEPIPPAPIRGRPIFTR